MQVVQSKFVTRGSKVDTTSASVHHTVVQQYIPNPYLVGGYKFDCRVYVLVTSFWPLEVTHTACAHGTCTGTRSRSDDTHLIESMIS
jgi:hypothetical protein